jgi:DNA-binding beta-propeller fold protein YncE
VLAAVVASLTGSADARETVRLGGDWTRFGYDAARHGAGPARVGITAANVRSLRVQRVRLPGTVDSSAIYLRGVAVGGRTRDVFFMTTSYGRTVAVEASSGKLLWTFTPRGYASWAGSDRITQSTPVADPGRHYLYSAAPDGRIHKLAVASGAEVRSGGWPVAITRDPTHEKIAPALNFSRGRVLAATGGYIGDAPPYQGHVAAIDARSGRLVHVWNGLCSERSDLIVPSSCPESGSAIWARSGVVVDPQTGNLLVATGDGKWDGARYWGDSVLMLSPNAARLLQSWTPENESQLDSGDVDLGSTAPALLSATLAVQSGKDARLRLLSLQQLNGRTASPGQKGGELQTLDTPGSSGLLAAPAVWTASGRVWLFVATREGTGAYVLDGARLRLAWGNGTPGTSPVVAGGLLYVYDAEGGGLDVYRPTTGASVIRLAAGDGHWNSPIVTDGRIALPEGDANDHETTGILNVYRLLS